MSEETAKEVLKQMPHMHRAEGQPAQAISVMVLNGLPLGGNFLSNSILADVIDYDEVRGVPPATGCMLLPARLLWWRSCLGQGVGRCLCCSQAASLAPSLQLRHG